MRKTNIISATPADFLPYGQCTATGAQTALWISRPLKLGLTVSDGGKLICSEMERHKSTEEYLFSGETDMLLAVSDDPADTAPRSENIRIFAIAPGTVVKLNPGIWHAACRHPLSDSYYYFMAHNNGSPDETKWFNVVPEPVCAAPAADAHASGTCPVSFTPHSSIFRARNHPVAPAVCTPEIRHIIFQNEDICTGNHWRCWMTADDCLGSGGYLRMWPLTAQKAACVHVPSGKTAVIFCGNCHLAANLPGTLEPVTLMPGEILKITAVEATAEIKLQPASAPFCHTDDSPVWFYVLSDIPLT